MRLASTLELLDRAIGKTGTASALADRLGVSRQALSVASRRGRLSPTLAGQIADLLGEKIASWMLIAALEAEPDRPALAKLRDKLMRTELT